MKNIILMLIDALRHDHVTPKITPNLMKIAGEGLFYENCQAGNTHTTKSVPVILNGDETYDPEKSVMADLGKKGYKSYCVHSNVLLGKMFEAGGWHHEVDLVLDRFKKERMIRKLVNRLPTPLFKTIRRYYRRNETPETYYPYSRASEILPYVYHKLSATLEEPYFLWIHLMDPHSPYYPQHLSFIPNNLKMRMNDKLRDATNKRYKPDEHDIEFWKYLYESEVTEMDRYIGEFLEGLCLEDKRLIITSDHGEEFGEYGGFSHTVDKFIPQLQHVPLIVVGKEKRVINKAFSHYQLKDLILEMAE